jgi:putative DNA primase/helicase
LAGPVPAEIILEESRHNQKTGGAPTPELMALRGKRLVWASETNEGKRLNAGKAKWLTGGDTLVGRSLYGKRMVSFAPTHTIFLITNHRPKANPDDYALWGRLHIVPFDLSFVDNPDPANSQERQRDKELADKLKTEAPGILAWIVRGFDDWQKWGLDAPEKVKVATESYRQNEDTVGQFIE